MKHQASEAHNDPYAGEGGEFMPPPAMPETWPMSWERQLAAMRAWQEARAEQDDAGGVPQAPTLQSLLKLHSLIGAAEERLQRMRSEAAELAADELARRAHGAHLAQPVAEAVAQRMQAMARSAQDTLGGLSRELHGLYARRHALPFERRRERCVIDFPDRRRAA